ncbi:MAG: hypothetical protein OXI96_02735 [Acidimicrobiaceae bacterium]|nr:hypothetical protein [Acidimicrobiaceae bacterium]
MAILLSSFDVAKHQFQKSYCEHATVYTPKTDTPIKDTGTAAETQETITNSQNSES